MPMACLLCCVFFYLLPLTALSLSCWLNNVGVRCDLNKELCFVAGTSMLIEDVACPVDKLADMTVDLVEMFQKFGYKDASCFGHALEGNLHLVFSQVLV